MDLSEFAKLTNPIDCLRLVRGELERSPPEFREGQRKQTLAHVAGFLRMVSKSTARMGDDPAVVTYCLSHGSGCLCQETMSEVSKERATLVSALADLHAVTLYVSAGIPGAAAGLALALGTVQGMDALASQGLLPPGWDEQLGGDSSG